ncbi:MAG: SH3 domain-containing protein [Pseudomonadota bacterium]
MTTLPRLLLALLLAVPAARAADTGTLTRAESLRARPLADATALAPLASGARVEIVTRSGGWYQVKAGGKTGWVRMLSVRRSAAAGGSSIAGLAGVASGRAGTGTITTTTGVRGLDAQDLSTATFDAAQLAQAESQRVSRAAAAAFARQGRLVARDVQPLPAPAKP